MECMAQTNAQVSAACVWSSVRVFSWVSEQKEEAVTTDLDIYRI